MKLSEMARGWDEVYRDVAKRHPLIAKLYPEKGKTMIHDARDLPAGELQRLAKKLIPPERYRDILVVVDRTTRLTRGDDPMRDGARAAAVCGCCGCASWLTPSARNATGACVYLCTDCIEAELRKEAATIGARDPSSTVLSIAKNDTAIATKQPDGTWLFPPGSGPEEALEIVSTLFAEERERTRTRIAELERACADLSRRLRENIAIDSFNVMRKHKLYDTPAYKEMAENYERAQKKEHLEHGPIGPLERIV